jgi:DNA modification methylase
MVPVAELKPHPKNRNKHPKEQSQRLAAILNYQGWRYPVKVSKLSGFITSGHGRIEAAKVNNWPEVPVNFQDYESEEQEYADVQSDNAIASWAELDLSGINSDIGDLGPDFDIDLLGIKDFEIEPADKYGGDPDEVPEAKAEAVSKLGDVYELGEHKLLCGDCTDRTNVDQLMDGAKVDMVFTDPPYGMNLDTNYKSGWKSKWETSGLSGKERQMKDHAAVTGDNKPFDFETYYAMTKEVKEQFWWGADYYCQSLPTDGGWLVWDKTGGNDSLMDVGFNANFELVWSKQKHKRDLVKHTYKGVAGMKKEDGKRVHPTQKPVGLAEHFIIKYCKGSKVMDLFGGSGSTLIACEKTNRQCYMMEIEPKYIDVIVSRWCKYTDQYNIKRNGEDIVWPKSEDLEKK